MPVAIGYARVSTAAQVHEGNGLDVQHEKIAAWSRFQCLELEGIEEDAGVSGASTDNRPAFKRVMNRVLTLGKDACLVVYKLDRLGRNALDVQEALAVLLDAGVRVVAIADGVDSQSGMGSALLKLLTGILATFAELEKETITTRLQDGRKRAKASGRAYSREPSYGLTPAAAEGTLEAHPDEARAVLRIHELRAEGLSLRAIGEQLLAEGLRPRRAAVWAPSVVLRLAHGRTPEKKKTSSRITKARAAILDTKVA
jgi:DNA invertase Pin-like site-specific DNA recombinase